MIEPQRSQETIRDERPRHWRVETTLSAEFKVENVRFVHDPAWRESFFSIQGIRDIAEGKYEEVTPRVVFWRGVQILSAIAYCSFALGAGIVLFLSRPDVVLRGSLIFWGLFILMSMFWPEIEERLFWWRFERAGRRATVRRTS